MKIPIWVVIVLCGVAIAWIALATMPETDNCTPRLIAKYTNDMISHQECKVMPRCIIEPSDIRYFRNAQTNFKQCLIEHISELQNKTEESTEESTE